MTSRIQLDGFRYVVPGRPATWQRPTDDRRSGRRNVEHADQRAAKRTHQVLAIAALGSLRASWPLDGAFEVEVYGYWPDAKVGDADRLTSLAMDALEGLAYHSDRQVRRQSGSVAVDEANPRVEVVVRRIEETVQTKRERRAKGVV